MRHTFTALLTLAALLVAFPGCRSASSPQPATATSAPASAGFAENAFPPTLSDTDYHRDAWFTLDCLDCHADGIADAPIVRHEGMSPRLLTAQCRSCHVLIPGQSPEEDSARNN